MKLYLEIFAASLAGILLEIAYTRIFSFKVFYYFTYVIIGIGLMGLGAGGVLVAVSARIREAKLDRLLPALCFAGGASILFGYWLVAPLPLNMSELDLRPFELPKLVFACLVLTVPFLCIGIIVSTILGARPERASSLYAADLFAAALGCTLAIPLLHLLDPPRAVVLSGFVLAAGGLKLAVRTRRLLLAGVATVVGILVPALTGLTLADPVTDRGKLFEELRHSGYHRFEKWNPVFRIDVFEHPFHPGEIYFVYHDGTPGSGLRRFTGDLREHDRMRSDPRALPFQVLGDEPEVLIVGSAGGHEVLASLFFGAGHVTGVELNPATISLLTDHFADFTGHLPEHPKVDFINGDARWFLKQTDEKYDLIWYVAPDSYAAMNAATSGAFVLSESYLYTVEMLKETLGHLHPGGVVCAQFGDMDYERRPNRTTRFVATARAALEALGIKSVRRHLLVAGAPGFPPQQDAVILVSPTAFTERQIESFVDYIPNIEQGRILYAPDRPPDFSPVNQVVALSQSDLERFYEKHPYQVDPVYDDAPFFWHFTRFRDAVRTDLELGKGGVLDFEVAIGEKFTIYLLGVVALLAAVFLLLPFFVVRTTWREMPYKYRSAVYFTALGLGFMFIEVALIQKFTLFVGYPTRSLSITLFGILLSSGAGSLLSQKYLSRRNRALFLLLAALVALVLSYRLALPFVIDRYGGASLPVRTAMTIGLIAPLGLCLGAFMPVGLSTVAGTTRHPREYVAWAWAVNGFFSVIASILSTILAMTWGYKLVLLLSVGIYAAGVGALATVPEERGRARA